MSTTTKRTTFLVLLLTTIAILATACSSGDDDEDAQDSESNEADSSTTSESTTTTIPAEGPPEWVEVAQDIQNRDAALFVEPDPERVADVYAETCTCYQDVYDGVQGFVDEGTHIEGDPDRVAWVRQETSDQDGLVRLSIRLETTRIAIVDADGTALDESSPEEVGVSMCFTMLIDDDGPDGAYRVHGSSPLDGCPEGSGG